MLFKNNFASRTLLHAEVLLVRGTSGGTSPVVGLERGAGHRFLCLHHHGSRDVETQSGLQISGPVLLLQGGGMQVGMGFISDAALALMGSRCLVMSRVSNHSDRKQGNVKDYTHFYKFQLNVLFGFVQPRRVCVCLSILLLFLIQCNFNHLTYFE